MAAAVVAAVVVLAAVVSLEAVYAEFAFAGPQQLLGSWSLVVAVHKLLVKQYSRFAIEVVFVAPRKVPVSTVAVRLVLV